MCGYAGFVSSRYSNEESQAILNRLIGEIGHRGPDDCGTLVEQPVALGFRRLSIIDLAQGHQPLFNEDGRLALVFNGEIYNYVELREMLLGKGHRFSTSTDSEVVLHLYEEYGRGCLSYLRGMFSFLIWDKEARTLFGARDRFGIKPLYYWKKGGEFVAASEAKSILEFPGVGRKIDELALQHYFTFQFVPDPMTLFADIRRLPPAHALWLEDDKLEIFPYWELRFAPEDRPLEHFVEGTRHMLREAVGMHMMSEVPRGAFLSSGIDSSVIAALLRQMDQLKTFSVGYADDRYNELIDARRTAEILGTEHREKTISGREFLDRLPQIVWHMDEPVADPAACSLFFVAELAAKDITVVLSGEGADEVFGGYGIYREPAEVAKFGRIPSPLRALIRSLAAALPEGVKGKDYVRRASTPLSERYFGNALIFSEAEKDRLLSGLRGARVSPLEVTAPYFAAVSDLDDIAQMQYLDFKTWMSGDILTKADRMTMAHALELRVPFLDHRLVEFAATIPHHLKIASGMTKYVLRQAAKEWLPREVVERPKRGFPVPTREWIRTEWQAEVRESLSGGPADGLFDRTYALQLLDEHLQSKRDNSRRLWCLLVLQQWYGLFIEQSIMPHRPK